MPGAAAGSQQSPTEADPARRISRLTRSIRFTRNGGLTADSAPNMVRRTLR